MLAGAENGLQPVLICATTCLHDEEIMRTALGLLFSLALLCACKHAPDDSGDSGGGGSGGHAGNPKACPTFAPDPMSSCNDVGVSCSYDQSDECYTTLAVAECTDAGWIVTKDSHDDCCPDELPMAGESCVEPTLSGGLAHPCYFTSPDCSVTEVFVCKEGTWENMQPACSSP
ncbi:Hypothetical protein A7982_05095 [Minicystis rosea]|nr:Hypothetical protein A7982_05095 [Minicystis rosea]